MLEISKELGYYSLALKANDASEFTASLFSPKEAPSGTPAIFEIGFAPVPEPSSMLMGILSLGSLFGLRRNKK